MRALCTLETRPLSAANDLKRSTVSVKPCANFVGFPLYPSESPCFPQENTAVSMSYSVGQHQMELLCAERLQRDNWLRLSSPPVDALHK